MFQIDNRSMRGIKIFISLSAVLAFFVISGCNYNYYTGKKLEEQGRYEEANIEFHRAYTNYPDDEDFKEAYERTSLKTVEDLFERYDRFVKDKKYPSAYQLLEKANFLEPENPRVQTEMQKWYHILLAGKVELTQIKSLRNQLPLTDSITLVIKFNTPNVTRQLEASIDYQNHTFSVEDVLYDPPQNLLMLYSVNSIGVNLVNSTTRRTQYKKFIDFRVPVLVDVQGSLKSNGNGLESVRNNYPLDQLSFYNGHNYWLPSRGIRYSLKLDEDDIKVNSSVVHLDFLPFMLYINREDRRYFLDFGHLQLSQRKTGGLWSFRRLVTPERGYLDQLYKNLILNPYFYYREGGYPFVKE